MQTSKQGYVIYEGRIVFCKPDSVVTDRGIVYRFWLPKYPETIYKAFGAERFERE